MISNIEFPQKEIQNLIQPKVDHLFKIKIYTHLHYQYLSINSTKDCLYIPIAIRYYLKQEFHQIYPQSILRNIIYLHIFYQIFYKWIDYSKYLKNHSIPLENFHLYFLIKLTLLHFSIYFKYRHLFLPNFRLVLWSYQTKVHSIQQDYLSPMDFLFLII